MLLAAFLQHFDSLPPERYRTLGASSLGRCARALAMAHFPEAFTPEPMTARRRARMMAGIEFERMVQQRIQAMLPAEAAGETAFLWPVPVDAETMTRTLDKIREGRISGHVLHYMNPNDIPRWRHVCREKGMNRLGGIVIDPSAETVYVPALADGIADLARMPEFAHEPYALATQEFKTIATAGFRKVLGGAVDYGYRTQFAIQVDAAKLDTHVAMFYRLETSHGIEIIYSRKAEAVKARFALSNGSAHYAAAPIQEPADEWDEVQIHHPFEPRLLIQAQERLRRVLGSTIDALPEREYGPDFRCPKCKGAGSLKCGHCDADGIAKRSKVTRQGEPKPGVPCKRSQGSPTVPCETCAGDPQGVATAELGFPCGWCPFLASCYPFAKRIIPDKAFARPRIMVSRTDYEQSGITYRRPE